jgi:hypothetical protein
MKSDGAFHIIAFIAELFNSISIETTRQRMK